MNVRTGSSSSAPEQRAVSPYLVVGAVSDADDGLLTRRQLELLKMIAEQDTTYGRRARALTALHEGTTQAEAGAAAGLAPRTVRYWLARFRREKLEIFPDDVLEEAGARLTVAPVAGSAVATARPSKAAADPEEDADAPGIRPDDTMSEAAGKTLRFQFKRMLACEAGTRSGEDPEDLHDMRVATRRMRAILRVCRPYIDWKAIKPYRKAIRRTAKKLGKVRDLDVYYEKMMRYLDNRAKDKRPNLEPLIEAWRRDHSRAREGLLTYLDGNRYRDFKDRFGEFLSTPLPAPDPVEGDGTIRPSLVRHVVPGIIYERLAHVCAYDGHILRPDDPLCRYHRLRIAGKHLRYAFEFFVEVLDPEAEEIIDHLKVLQDHLGDLQDAVIAVEKLQIFWLWGQLTVPKDAKDRALEVPVIAPGVAVYHADKQAEIQALLDTYPDIWQWFHSSDFNKLVARAVSPL